MGLVPQQTTAKNGYIQLSFSLTLLRRYKNKKIALLRPIPCKIEVFLSKWLHQKKRYIKQPRLDFYTLEKLLCRFCFSFYRLSLFWFHLITEGAQSRLDLFNSFALRNYLFRIPNIFETNFKVRNRLETWYH